LELAQRSAREAPILEFDPTRRAVVEPTNASPRVDVAEHCVPRFFQEVITKLCQEHNAKTVTSFKYEDAPHLLHELNVNGDRLAFFHPGIGAPMAAALLEQVIASGCKKFIACGSAGVLDKQLAVGRIIVPNAAVRDEGASYHYLPQSREARASPEAVAAIENVLKQRNTKYFISKTWTTDGPFRETPAKVHTRRAEGCLCVEMEAAALFAVAQFRNVVFAQLLYSGDDVSGSDWDRRRSTEELRTRTAVREQLFWLAAEACLTL
jgi:uridine phosphorylase